MHRRLQYTQVGANPLVRNTSVCLKETWKIYDWYSITNSGYDTFLFQRERMLLDVCLFKVEMQKYIIQDDWDALLCVHKYLRGKCAPACVHKHTHKNTICKWPARASAILMVLLIFSGPCFHGAKVYLDFTAFTGVLPATLHYCYLNTAPFPIKSVM